MTARRARARTITEDPARWPACPRCGRSYQRARRWPEGRVCHYCATAALQTTGRCASCEHHGVLPGLDPATGAPTCRACAAIPVEVCCRRCGEEAALGRTTTCWRCLLTARTESLLAGPETTIPAPLVPLATAITTMPSANSGHAWLSNPEVADLLHRLAVSELALTHAALDELRSSRTVEHLRGLLMLQGCLPGRDPHLVGYERWLARKLDTIADPDHRTIIDRFGRWHLLRQLRDRAAHGPISDGTFLNAKQTTTVTLGFLAWLTDRDTVLAEVTQHDLDAWFAHGRSTGKHAVRFLYWARDQRLIPRQLEIPVPRTRQADPTGTGQRLALLHRALRDPELGALSLRVAAALVLLFGLTPRQLTELTLTDITHTDHQTWLRVGRDPLPLPGPVAELLHGLLADPRYRHNTTNHDSGWLFPGTRPGRPIHPNTLAAALQRAGIPTQSARAGTWLDLVRSAPAPLLADALGVSPVTTARYAERAGAHYATYPR